MSYKTEKKNPIWAGQCTVKNLPFKKAKFYILLLTIELEDRPLILNWEKNPGRTPY